MHKNYTIHRAYPNMLVYRQEKVQLLVKRSFENATMANPFCAADARSCVIVLFNTAIQPEGIKTDTGFGFLFLADSFVFVIFFAPSSSFTG
jgi:hypothetical protein